MKKSLIIVLVSFAFSSNFFSQCSPTYASITELSCDQYTSPSGNYIWYSNGTYTDTIFTCNPYETIDAGAGFSSYLWSTGETTQSISVNNSGTYSVTVSSDIGCQYSSSVYVFYDCLDVNNLLSSEVAFFPNPVNDQFTIENTNPYSKVTLVDALGREIILGISNETGSFKGNISALAPDVYSIIIKSINSKTTFQVIKT